MILAKSLNCVFIHIHKTGGTSLEIGLDPFLTWEDLLLGSTPLGEVMNDQFRRRHGLHKHSSIQDVRKVCGNDVVAGAYRFALVRHPLSRVVSLYNFVGSIAKKWCGFNNTTLDEIKTDLPRFIKLYRPLGWPASRAFLLSASFDEFLTRPELAHDEGFFTQVSRISIDGELACFALKLEESSGWLPSLRARLGVEFDLPHQNASEHKFTSVKDLAPQTIRKFESMFREDYIKLGY